MIQVSNLFLFFQVERTFIRKHHRQVQAKIITMRAGLVTVSAGVGEGLVSLLAGVHRIGQNLSRCGIIQHSHICLSFSCLSTSF